MSAFDKVIGYENEKEELFQLCDMAKNPEKYAALGVKLPRGILLHGVHGVPGVGKTLMASALIEEMGEDRNRYVLRKDKSNEEFVESISKTFQEAKAHAPSVIFLDDLDKFASDSDSRNPEELIAVQSGIDEVKGTDVFVVATANEICELPRSLRRAGRFDRILEICPPNRKEAVEIVRHYLKDKKVAADVTAESVPVRRSNRCSTRRVFMPGMKINRKSGANTSCARCCGTSLRRTNRSTKYLRRRKKRSPSMRRDMPWRRLRLIPKASDSFRFDRAGAMRAASCSSLRAKITSVLTTKCMSASFLFLRGVPPWNLNSVARMSERVRIWNARQL